MKEPSFPLDEVHKAELRRVFKQGGNISKVEGDWLIELRKTHTLKQTAKITGRHKSTISRYVSKAQGSTRITADEWALIEMLRRSKTLAQVARITGRNLHHISSQLIKRRKNAS